MIPAEPVDWHIGKPPHEDSLRVAKENGISIEHLRARQFASRDYLRFDLIVAMDEENLEYLEDKIPKNSKARLCLLREYDSRSGDFNVPDPYYEGNFQAVFNIIQRCCRRLFKEVSG